ncbi:receptor-like protein EIX2 [Glycine soja]|nr:receptor-like protein EIX2 [Glycine soja]
MIYMQNQQLHLFSIYSCVIMNSSIYILVFVQLWLFSLPCRESVCIPSERETLLKFKNNLNDPSNRLWSWNHNHTNCCHWYGVLCHNLTSHLLQLHLHTSDYANWEAYRRWSFGGEISPCLADLKHLNYLDLSGNLFLGEGMSIPSFLGTMTSLTHLDLSDTGFRGKIPSQIGNLSNLVYLDLAYAANETIPSQIGNLSNLVYLVLGGHSVVEPLFAENVEWVSSMWKLEYLDLSYANLSKAFHWLHTLQSLPSLTLLCLSDCTLPHYNEPSLLNFSSLQTLILYNTSYSPAISFVPKWIFKLKKLVSLQLHGNEIQGPIPCGIRNLTLIQNLDLSGNSFSSSIPDCLYGLHRLKSLEIHSSNLHGTISDALGNLTSLVELHLSNNQLEGTIPTSLGNLTSLFALYLSYNQLEGTIPTFLGNLRNSREIDLTILDLSINKFSGNPFESLGSLSKLSSLWIDGNNFQGVVKEDDLANLTSLTDFGASGNNFTLKVGPNWIPNFQLTYLEVTSWQLGPSFPLWIQSQNQLQYVGLSNTGILDSIPTWFWEAHSQVLYLNLSHNHIHGELVTTIKNPISIQTVDLCTNHLCGKLPYLSNDVYDLDLSTNSFSESMQDFLCNNQDKPMQLEFLNLASNNLSGEIPDCWINWPFLVEVNLQSNHFVGNFPPSMGSLAELQSLEIRNNLLSGIFPTSLKKTSQLISLDLGENNLSGCIPTWVGEKLSNMKILRLRSNSFSGHIPNEICQMSLLQVLDLAKNSLSGNIPSCFRNLSAMTLVNRSTYPLIYSQAPNDTQYFSVSGIVSVLLWLKGRGDEYGNILGLVTSIDLSSNKLLGEIPREITDLNGLNFLNLSHNQLIGPIPEGIGNMGSLQTIDFSRNQISGEIPPTISNLSFLSMLDVSYNHLKGKIPTGTQLQTFDASSFIGNNLCGPPLPINCSSNGKTHSYEGSHGHGVNWFFVSATIGFVVGLWIVIAPLLICRSWRHAYFHFLDHVWFKLQSFSSYSITV